MLIKDIKFRRIRKLARKRVNINYYWYKCSLDRVDGDIGFLESSFDWYNSPEGYLFWSFVHEGAYEEAYELIPGLFKPTKKEFKEAYKMHENYERLA